MHASPMILSVLALTTLGLASPALAAPSPSSPPDADTQTSEHSGLVERVSAHSFDETVARLRAGIEKRPLKLFAEIDHAKGASDAGLELAPSTLFIFGNPKGGTPLMQREARMGLALPLKMHVFEHGGKVIVSYTDMTALSRRYGLDPEAQPIPNIAAMLAGLAAEAASEAAE